VVASDRETAAAAAVAGARVQHHPRSGKAAAINAAVSASRADLIILTDANCSFAPDNWLRLVMDSFCCAALICGRKAELGSLERLSRKYAEFDLAADRREVVALPFAVGEALAFRRSDFIPIPETTLVDDLAISLSFIRRRLPIGVATKWVVSEPAASSRQQWERRVRMATGVMREVSPQIAQLLAFPQGRVLLACKYWRLTIGNAAYWTMVTGLLVRYRKVWQWFAMGTLAIVPSVLFKFGLLGRSLISQMVVPLALQAVPPAAVVRLMRRPSGVWRKEPR
jgi:glycosyltransferase involved in cell wall biosynthesis